MKKNFFFVLVIFSFSQLHALYQSNPAASNIVDEGLFFGCDSFMSVKLGYQRDQIFDRKLVAKGGATGEVSDAEQLYDQGVLILNLMDRVELFGSAGAMNINITDIQKLSTAGVAVPYQFEYQTFNDFTWGAGIRASIIQWCHTTLGASANYQFAHPKVHWNTVDGAPFSSSAYIRWAEWQFGAALSYQIDIFSPYIGVNYSRVNAKVRNIANIPAIPLFPKGFSMHSREHFGLALGCDLSTGKIFDLGVEVRMISEQAITLVGNLKF